MAAQPSISSLVSRDEMIQCALPTWYPNFADVTFASIMIPLTPDFMSYLEDDGLILPEGCVLSTLEGNNTSDEEEETDWGTQEEPVKCPKFPDLVQRISEAIQTLGGAVVPKLNWSSPRDAVWVCPCNTLKCTSPAEVILLLKSSDFVSHDVSRVYQYCQELERSDFPYMLCLRRWTDIQPSAEFRCFVHKRQIIGMSQRDCTNYYHHLTDTREDILCDIMEFFAEHINPKFPLHNYTMDVYRVGKGRVMLVDFNPFAPLTDSLLFSWEELYELATPTGTADMPVVRIIEDPTGIQPSDLSESRLPKDISDLMAGRDIHKLVDLMEMARQKQQNDEPVNR